MYIKNTWLDRLVQFPRRYKDQNDNIYLFEPEPGVVTEPGTTVTALYMNNIETGIQQNNLFNLLLTPGRKKGTKFDTPSQGNITEEIRLVSDNSLYATLITVFDSPTLGDITTTLECTDLNIHNRVITEFDDLTGEITETSEVMV